MSFFHWCRQLVRTLRFEQWRFRSLLGTTGHRFLFYAIVLACELTAFHWNILVHPSKFIIPWDFRYTHLPMAAFIANSLRKGHLPLWDPYTYSGLPFYATLQPQLFYPPTFLTALISNLVGGNHLAYFLEIQELLHIYFGGLGMCLLLRRLRIEGWAALIGATVFQLGPYFTSQLQHLGAVDAAAWIPIACFFTVDIMLSPSRCSALGLSFALAMSFLCGFPSATSAVAISCLLLAILIPVIQPDARLHMRRSVMWLGIAFLLAVGLAAIELIPSARLEALSVSRFRADWMGDGGGMPLEALVSLIVPNYHHIFNLSQYSLRWNPTFLYLYCGIPPLILVPFAFARKTRAWAIIFGIFTLAFFLAMLGTSTELGRVFMPLFLRLTRYSVYVEFLMAGFVIGTAVLASLGASRVLTRTWHGVILTAIIALDLTHTGAGTIFNTSSIQSEPGVTHDQFNGSAKLLARIRAELNMGTPEYRLDTVNDSVAWATAAPLLEIPTSNGDDPFALSTYLRIRSLFCKGVTRWGRYYQVSDPNSRWLDFLGVRLLLSRTPINPRSHWMKFADLPGTIAYANSHVLPRFFFVSNVLMAKTADEAFHLMQTSSFDPGTTAVLHLATEQKMNSTQDCNLGHVIIKHYDSDFVKLDVNSIGDCLLVSSDVFYSGWHATIDGHNAQLLPANLCFRAVVVPGGRHDIALNFHPFDLYCSFLISLCATALWITIFFKPIFFH